MEKKNGNFLAIAIMFFLFMMISFVTGLQNPFGVIVKQQFSATNLMSQLGNAANFIAYAFMGLPAGLILSKKGYKFTALSAVAVGLVGVTITFLSGMVGSFGVYLLGAFVSGFSMCMLNTVVNPMLNTLGGGGNKGNQLIQWGGSCNSLAATICPVFVGYLIGEVSQDTKIADANPALFIAMGIFALAFIIILLSDIPEPELAAAAASADAPKEGTMATIKGALSYKHFVFGIIAIFLYVGVEVGIPGTLNFYLSDSVNGAGMDPSTAVAIAGFVAGTYWLLMLVGRLTSSVISGKVSARTQLTCVSAVALVLIVLAIILGNSSTVSMPVFKGGADGFGMVQVPIAALLLVLCGLCTSVMWGTIFDLACEGLGASTNQASGIFMAMVVGGGIVPLIQNAIADAIGYMPSYWLLVACVGFILYFAAVGSKVKKA